MYDLQAKALLWIIREDNILGYRAPRMPNVKRVSHVVTVTPKPLPREFQLLMDNAKEGVVIVSFGSILKSAPPGMVDKLFEAFKKTKYNFVMRHSTLNSSDPEKFCSATDFLSMIYYVIKTQDCLSHIVDQTANKSQSLPEFQ